MTARMFAADVAAHLAAGLAIAVAGFLLTIPITNPTIHAIVCLSIAGAATGRFTRQNGGTQ